MPPKKPAAGKTGKGAAGGDEDKSKDKKAGTGSSIKVKQFSNMNSESWSLHVYHSYFN